MSFNTARFTALLENDKTYLVRGGEYAVQFGREGREGGRGGGGGSSSKRGTKVEKCVNALNGYIAGPERTLNTNLST